MTKPVLLVGSASIHVARMARGLLAAGQPVVLATHGELKIDPHPLLLAYKQVDLSIKRLDAPYRLRRLIKRWAPRVLHAHQANSVGWHAARAVRGTGVPLVLTLWGSDVLTLPSRSAFHRWLVRSALRGAQAWTADAQVLLAAAAALAPEAAATPREWIPLGIDEPPALPGVQPERRILSCRLHKPLYRIDAILQAFARLPGRCANWRLEVAAAGPQTDELRRMADTLGIAARVDFTGMLDAQSLARSYRRAAVFVSVPESDGTSVSLLESLAAGCLPVLSDLPANREWVTDGHNGLLVADLARLDDALLRAIDTWDTGTWARDGQPFNRQLVRDKAMFEGNIRQFIALHARLENRAS
jgi:glycosyltransferase involved in cell wall biosynthesis